MAESQVPYPYCEDDYIAIRASLSAPRYDAYLHQARGNENYAVKLYLYNARLSKALLFPLSMAEVTLRNAVDQALVSFCDDEQWYENQDFLENTLSIESANSIEKAKERLGTRLTKDRLVAELTFDFWSNLFRTEYHEIWRTERTVVFPNCERQDSRGEIQKVVKAINKLRNRVAHHEPVLDMNVSDTLSKIHKVIGLRCKITQKWVRAHTTVNIVIRDKPSRKQNSSNLFETNYDKNMLKVDAGTNLSMIDFASQAHQSVAIVVDIDGRFETAIFYSDFMKYIHDTSAKDGGIIDLNDHCVRDVINAAPDEHEHQVMSKDDQYADVIECLRRSGKKVVVGVDTDGFPRGYIMKSHRRY